MLAEKLKHLESEYCKLFAHGLSLERHDPPTIQSSRRRFVDCLFDDFLSREDLFRTFNVIGKSLSNGEDVILDYGTGTGYGSAQEQYDEVSHYQFVVLNYRGQNYLDPGLLLLRDKDTSKIKLYEINKDRNKDESKIGVNNDLKVLYEERFTSSTEISKGNVRTREISRDELCNPFSYLIGMFSKDQGKLFDAFYTGLQHLCDNSLEKISKIKGKTPSWEPDLAYHALQALIKK